MNKHFELTITTDSGTKTVNAKRVSAAIADGSKVSAGLFDDIYGFNFTDIESGAVLLRSDAQNERSAINEFTQKMKRVRPEIMKRERDKIAAIVRGREASQ